MLQGPLKVPYVRLILDHFLHNLAAPRRRRCQKSFRRGRCGIDHCRNHRLLLFLLLLYRGKHNSGLVCRVGNLVLLQRRRLPIMLLELGYC